MNVIDIIALIILAYAAYSGFKHGFVVEICQLLSIVIGAYLAYHFSDLLIPHLPVSKEIATILAFVLVVVGVVILIAIVSRIISKLLSFTVLGIINQLLGSVVSVFKSSIVVALLVSSLSYLNSVTDWIPKSTFSTSYAVKYSKFLNSTLFPYMKHFSQYYEKFIEVIPSNEGNSNKGNGELV